MSVKVFTTGEVLTASDTNSYLANSGLVYIKSQTIGSAVSSVTVSSAFSADYDNYRIVISGGTCTTAANINASLGASTTGYYSVLQYVTYSVGSVLVANTSNGASWPYIGNGTTNNINASFDLLTPFLAKTTGINGPYIENAITGSVGTFTGYHNSAVSYSSIVFTAGAGTMTGGTITVYGYRKG